MQGGTAVPENSRCGPDDVTIRTSNCARPACGAHRREDVQEQDFIRPRTSLENKINLAALSLSTG